MLRYLKKRFFAGLLVMMFVCVTASGQESFPGFDNVIPPSPEASALMKGVNVPVSYYTGIPSVSIPIWTMKGRKLSVPVSLSYHASGVKVDEVAGWVGLGWSLNAGGAISRTVRGKADDEELGFLTLHGNQIPGIEDNPDELGRWEIPGEDEAAQMEYLKRIANNIRDGEPDIFQFNFNGRSGKFYFNVNGEVVLQSRENLKIIYSKDAEGLINSWQIVDESGNIYSFGTDAAMERTAPANSLGYQGEFYTSTWYLQSIRSANDEDLFWFDYEDYSKVVKYSMPQRKVSGNDPKWEDMYNFQSQFVEGKHLNKITYPGGQVSFNSEKIFGYPGGEIRGLTEIAIKDLKTGIAVKTYRFNYSFFPSVGCGTQQDYLPPCRRLRLDKIREIPGEGEETKPPYMFFYDESPLPSRGSFSRDHWGFYNGAMNDHLVPAVSVWNFHDTDLVDRLKQYKGMTSFSSLTDIHVSLPDVAEDVWELSGADREPNQEMSQAGILKKIVYPTGGSTILEYEPHDFGYYSTTENKQILKIEAKNDFVNNYGITEERKLVVKHGQEVKIAPLFYIIEGSIKDQTPETRIPSDYSEVYIRGPVIYDNDGDTVYSCSFKRANEVAGGMENEDKLWLDPGTYYVGVFAKDLGDLTRVVLDYKAGSIYDTVYKVFSQEYSDEILKAGDKYFPDDISEYRSGTFTLDSLDYPLVQFEFFFRSEIHPNRISSVGLEYPLSKVVVTKIGVDAGVVFERSYYDEDLIRWDVANEEYIYSAQLKQILKPGRYQVEFIPRINTEFGFLSLKWKRSQKINNYKTAGGLRIKRIIEKDGETDTLGITDFKYVTYENGEERSSGVLMSYPFYYDLPKDNYYLGSSMVSDLDNLHISLYSSGKSITGSTLGSHIGYSRVQVSRPGSGYTAYDFTSAIDYPDISSNEFPFSPEVSFDWKRGQLKEKRIYRDNGKLRQKEVYTFNDVNDTINRVLIPAIKVVQKDPASDYAYLFKKYYMFTAWNTTGRREVFTYDLEGGSPVGVVEEYDYDPAHLQLIHSRKWESDSSQLENILTYPYDLMDDKSHELTMLRSKHMVNVVLKTETFMDEKRISGLNTKYGIFNTSMIFPKTIEKLEGDEYSAVMHIDRYDDKGNIIQYHREGDLFNSFNWDDEKRFPIAKVVNAEYQDNIQDYSGDALITKYNYHPFWGVTSETSPNNMSLYYDYDNYGRITVVRNNEHKILKAYDYHLKSFEGDTSRPGFTTKELVFSTNPEEVLASKTSVVKFCGLILQVSGGVLGTAAEWVWYDDFCGGNEIARGISVEVYPLENTQYFVRAEGEANKTSCASISINIVDPSVHPDPGVLAFEAFGTGHNLQDVILNYNACDPLRIESDVDWLNIQNITNKSFGVECKPSTLKFERLGNITITGNGFEEIIKVTQLGSGGF